MKVILTVHFVLDINIQKVVKFVGHKI